MASHSSDDDGVGRRRAAAPWRRREEVEGRRRRGRPDPAVSFLDLAAVGVRGDGGGVVKVRAAAALGRRPEGKGRPASGRLFLGFGGREGSWRCRRPAVCEGDGRWRRCQPAKMEPSLGERCMWPAEVRDGDRWRWLLPAKVVSRWILVVEVAGEVAGLLGGRRWVGRAVAAVARSFGKP
uniref:Uncharacterized protein n=1 Tax=Oryza meridionalis TaxID=40149 RepID=A0A0E0ECM1_9ORYZ